MRNHAGRRVVLRHQLCGGKNRLAKPFRQSRLERLNQQGAVALCYPLEQRPFYCSLLFGFNSFKWSKKIEPLKYEIAQKRFLYSREDIAGIAAGHFFNLASAQAEYDMAVEDVFSTDSLYIAGKERSRISTIS